MSALRTDAFAVLGDHRGLGPDWHRTEDLSDFIERVEDDMFIHPYDHPPNLRFNEGVSALAAALINRLAAGER